MYKIIVFNILFELNFTKILHTQYYLLVIVLILMVGRYYSTHSCFGGHENNAICKCN